MQISSSLWIIKKPNKPYLQPKVKNRYSRHPKTREVSRRAPVMITVKSANRTMKRIAILINLKNWLNGEMLAPKFMNSMSRSSKKSSRKLRTRSLK